MTWNRWMPLWPGLCFIKWLNAINWKVSRPRFRRWVTCSCVSPIPENRRRDFLNSGKKKKKHEERVEKLLGSKKKIEIVLECMMQRIKVYLFFFPPHSVHSFLVLFLPYFFDNCGSSFGFLWTVWSLNACQCLFQKLQLKFWVMIGNLFLADFCFPSVFLFVCLL